ncbi:MAG: CAP domain-containing protein [Rhizomicrobium sp.]
MRYRAGTTAASVIVIAALAFALPARAAPFTKNQELELLAAHNKYRAALGESALRWSDDLAASASAWAQHLANDVHALKHSGALAKGENLAMWSAGRASLTQLVDLWGAEKHYFVEASFPNVSTTGNWRTVAHYTQMIWRNTTEVGCGLATGGGNDYLVCQYSPQGNFMGQKVF